MNKELIAFVIDHLKSFKSDEEGNPLLDDITGEVCYPVEFEYNNKVYDYAFYHKDNKRKEE
jgi:hypothetical protein